MRAAAMLARALMGGIVAAPAVAHDRCSDDALTRARTEVEAARQALPPNPDRLPLDPPELSLQEQHKIGAFKDRILAFATAVVACMGADATGDVSERLSAAARQRSADDSRYGDELSFEVSQPAAPEGLMVVVARFRIPCGSDAMLIVFARRPEGWTPVLRWQADSYKHAIAAFGDFGYDLSPDRSGGWYIVTKWVGPRCYTGWRGLSYAALRPRPGHLDPKVLLKRRAPVKVDSEQTLTARLDSFEVRFEQQSSDVDVFSRSSVHHFGIRGDVVRRIPPWALSARDFVEEWIDVAWPEAVSWSSPQLARQRALRDTLGGWFTYKSMRACPGGDRVQVEIERDEGPARRIYFQVAGEGGDYRMAKVDRRPDPACRGRNLLPQRPAPPTSWSPVRP